MITGPGNVSIFSLARLHSQYISHAQLIASTNIANISTPGFKATHVRDFNNWSNTLHSLNTDQSAVKFDLSQRATRPSFNEQVSTISGNTVSIEAELARAGEIRRMHSMNTSIVRSFHRMFIAGVKG